MTYAKKLKEPRWHSRRFEIISKANYVCEDCGQLFRLDELQVHHLFYLRNLEPWEYPDDLLMCLCGTCHLNRQLDDEEAMIEFARVLRCMPSCHSRALAKNLN